MEPTNLQMQLDNFLFCLCIIGFWRLVSPSIACLWVQSLDLVCLTIWTASFKQIIPTGHPCARPKQGPYMQWWPEEALSLTLVPVVWGPGEGRNEVIKYSVQNVKLQTEVCDIKEKFYENCGPEEVRSAHASGIFGSWEGGIYV